MYDFSEKKDNGFSLVLIWICVPNQVVFNSDLFFRKFSIYCTISPLFEKKGNRNLILCERSRMKE